MINLHLLKPFIIALFLGALVGFERAFSTRDFQGQDDILGGIRTFSLVSLFGSLVSFLSVQFMDILLPISFIGLIALTVVSYFISFNKHNERGITTEISLLICFIIGVVVQQNYLIHAVFITIVVVIVLHMKQYLNRFTDRIVLEDIRAILKFAIITFVILLFDPDYTFFVKDIGSLSEGIIQRFPGLPEVKVVNPYTVWLMVVLISGIGFTGYLAIKILGSRKGTGLTGFLGGLVSSTATTITFSKRSKEAAAIASGRDPIALSYSLAVLLACSTMFPRILVEVLIINPGLLPRLSITMGTMALAGFTFCFILWKRSGKETSEEVPHKNPFNILPAVKFGILYAVIVLITRLMEVVAGNSGLYIVSVLSGLTDVDAITLTMSQISRDDPSKITNASIAITLAAFSNTLLKAGLAFAMGSRRFRSIVLIGFSITIMAGIAGLLIMAFL